MWWIILLKRARFDRNQPNDRGGSDERRVRFGAQPARDPGTMKLRVQHEIEYRYSHPVLLSPQQLLFRPRDGPMIEVRNFDLRIDPAVQVYWSRDYRDNTLGWAYVDDFQDHLFVHVNFEVEMRESNPLAFILRIDAARFPLQYEPAEASLLAPYLVISPEETAVVLAWSRENLAEPSEDTLDFLARINRTIRDRLRYEPRPEAGVQTPEETITRRSGTCRDYAMLMMHLCRAHGLAARFVSGYLYDASDTAGENAGSVHAWVEVYLPGGGWKGFDPTHGILADDHFIPVASGRRPENLNPMTGAFFGSKEARATMEARVRIAEIP